MSARQRGRMRQGGLDPLLSLGGKPKEEEQEASEDDAEESEGSSEEEEEAVAASAFAAFDDSDEEEESESEVEDEEEGDEEGEEQEEGVKAPKKGDEEEAEDDLQILDSLIEEQRLEGTAGGERGSGHGTSLASLLACDKNGLKVENELKRKFGGRVMGGDGATAERANATGGRGGGRGRRVVVGGGATGAVSTLAMKKLLLGAPKADWSKPPSFVGGGLGMLEVFEQQAGGEEQKQQEEKGGQQGRQAAAKSKKARATSATARAGVPFYLQRGGEVGRWQRKQHGEDARWFKYTMSKEYEALQARYEIVHASMDPNNLAMFASQTHSHADSLLQLAMVFAHTGEMERAAEFVRRSLYVLESAYAEAFKPFEGRCRLDATRMLDNTFFAALFRHMQLCGMMGCAATATEVARLLLSLDPLGDPLGALLCLDHYAVASKKPQVVIDLFESGLPIGYSPEALQRLAEQEEREEAQAEQEEREQEEEDELEYEELGPNVEEEGEEGDKKVSSKLTEGGAAANGSTGGTMGGSCTTIRDMPGWSLSYSLALLDRGQRKEALSAARDALLKFPSALEPLLQEAGVANPRGATRPHNWQAVFQSQHFGAAQSRLRGGEAHTLSHLCKLFAKRNGDVWSHDRCLGLLFDGAALALQHRPEGREGGPNGGEGSMEREVLSRAYEGGWQGGTPSGEAEGEEEEGAEGQSNAAASSTAARRTRRARARAYVRYRGLASPLSKYAQLQPSDFADTFSQLPAAGLLNPQLLGPNMMNRRFAGGRQHRQLLEGRLDDVERHLLQGGELEQAMAAAEAGNLDPNSPLMQLLLQSLLPWNQMATPQHPPPPPPP